MEKLLKTIKEYVQLDGPCSCEGFDLCDTCKDRRELEDQFEYQLEGIVRHVITKRMAGA